MRLRTCFAVLAVIAFPAISRADVLKIVINDTIQAATAERVERALDQAAARKDDAVLIELSTPGGVMSDMREIMEKILASPVAVIIYVTPSGSRAASAGFFILESADIAAMAPGTNTGAAHPVGPFGGDIKGKMAEKVENDAAALMRSVVSKRGRNVEVAESAVRQSKSFTDNEALSQKLIDYVASSDEDLFRQISSKPIKRFNGESARLNLVGEKQVTMEETVKERILGFLMDPGDWGARTLHRVQSSRRGLAGNGGGCFYSSGYFCASFAPDSIRRRGADICLVRAICTGCEICRARRARDRGNRDAGNRRAAAG
jgi:membrane-bound serine protease (ClpP class)